MSLLNEPGELDEALASEDLVGLSVEGGAHAAWELHTHVCHAARYARDLTVVEVHDGHLTNTWGG